MRINIHQHNFGSYILNLAQNRVGGARGKTLLAEDIPAHLGAIQSVLEHR